MNATTIDSMFGVMLLAASVSAATAGAAVVVVFVARSEDVVVTDVLSLT